MTSTNEGTGSYNFEGYQDTEQEFARLERQANLMWMLEKTVLAGAGLRAGMRVLDVGCGPGFISRRMAAMVGPNGSVLGLDASEELLRAGRERLSPEEHAPVELRKGDCYAIDVPDESVDFVYARMLFQHLRDPLRAMGEMHGVLQSGGRICIVDADDGVLQFTPEPPGFAEFTRRAARHQQEAGGDREVGRKLGGYLKDAGFSDISVQIAVITSEQVGLSTLFELSTSFKTELFPIEERQEAAEALQQFRTTLTASKSFGLTGIYIACAARN